MATAPGPVKLAVREDTRGCRYSVDFALEVALAKYLDHLPLERQVHRMSHERLAIDSHTSWDQIEALARRLQPAHAALRERILSASIVGADEARWRLTEGHGSKRWRAWTLASPDAVCYRILPSRSQAAAREVLGEYRGVFVAEGYGACEALPRDGPARFTLAHCWAPVRRKSVESETRFLEPCREMLARIGELYAVECEAGDSLEPRAQLRAGR